MTQSFEFVRNLFIVSILFVTTSAAVNNLDFDGGNFKVTWNYSSASQEIEFEVRVKTTGYVALGLTKTDSGMGNLDLFVGGVTSGGASYLKDYHVHGFNTPDTDSKQNYTLLSASESNSETMVRCKRKLNTQDDEDQLIQPGDSLFIAWAYHTSSDTLVEHTNKGYSSQMHVLVPLMNASPSSPTTMGPTSSVTTSPDLTSETPTVPTTSTTESSSPSLPISISSTSSSLTFPSSSSTTTIKTTTAATTSSTITSPTTTLTRLEKTPTESIQTSSSSLTTTTTAFTTTATDTISISTIIQGVVPGTRTISEGPSPTSTVSPTTNPVSTITYNKDQVFKNGDYHVFWKFDSKTSELFFKLVVKATGWVGLGISNINSDMKDLDVVVAGVSGGQGYIGDYYSTAEKAPTRDSSEDYTLRAATDNGQTTTVEFKRKINTGDKKDLQIVVGESYYIAWAYHSSSDSLSYHGSSQRGYSGQKIILAAKSPPGSAATAMYSLVMTVLSLAYTLIVH